jgi:hypothetical protein
MQLQLALRMGRESEPMMGNHKLNPRQKEQKSDDTHISESSEATST